MECKKINMGSETIERKKKVKEFSIDYLLNLSTSTTTKKRAHSQDDETIAVKSKIQKPIPEYIQPFPMRTPSGDHSRLKLLRPTSPRERYTDELEAPSPTDILNSRKRGPETIGMTILDICFLLSVWIHFLSFERTKEHKHKVSRNLNLISLRCSIKLYVNIKANIKPLERTL